MNDFEFISKLAMVISEDPDIIRTSIEEDIPPPGIGGLVSPNPQYNRPNKTMKPIIDIDDIDTFTRSYIETMFWAENDDNGQPLEKNYSITDLSQSALRDISDDCEKFYNANLGYIEEGPIVRSKMSNDELAGYHFYLTRNGHGSGFWDGQWSEEAEEALTKSAKSFGSLSPYVGDDGLIYVS